MRNRRHSEVSCVPTRIRLHFVQKYKQDMWSENRITRTFQENEVKRVLTLSRASMGKSTVYGRWRLRHLNFVFICRMATRFRMKLRIELFFTVIKSF